LSLLYVIHDVLHSSQKSRPSGETSDLFSDAFRPHMLPFLGALTQNAKQGKKQKILLH